MLTPDCRVLFGLAETATYLDHGGFGVTPREVLAVRKTILDEIEQSPASHFAFAYRPAWREIAATVAGRFLARPEDLALVENVTDGINAVLRSLSFGDDDEILVTSLAYGAIINAASYISARQRARVINVPLVFPDPDPQQCVDAVKSAITPRTKLAILDHITSSTALVLPIVAMTAVCHDHGVPVLVDGAHVPGNIEFDLQSIKADWYAANLHKWSFVPRACGFLWAAPGRQESLVPTVLSWDIASPFPRSFEWTGTRDPSPWLSVPAAFSFMDRFGEGAIRRHNHQLLLDGARLLAEAWGISGNTPESMIGSMALVPLPAGLPFPATLEGCAELRQFLWDAHKIAASPSFVHDGTIWLRISAQIYNDIHDYMRLADIISSVRTRRS